jgi:activator of HSP90 ATPase
MSEQTLPAPTRRYIVPRIAMAFGALAAAPRILAQPAEKPMEQAAATDTRTSLHMDIDFKATPQRIYEALLDAKQFAAFSGLSAEIDPKVGGAFSMFQGQIGGRNVELVPNQRIVQAWRPGHWDPGVYSIVKFELKPAASGTTLILDHTGFPAGNFDSLSSGWHLHYFEPLKKFLV